MADIVLYTDGACSGNPGVGGYAAILIALDSTGSVVKEQVISGGAEHTTNNRMEIMAALEGLRALTAPTPVKIVSDSQYMVYTMTRGWKRKANLDLWEALDAAVQPHRVKWEYVRGHTGHTYNERCDALAVAEIHKLKARTRS